MKKLFVCFLLMMAVLVFLVPAVYAGETGVDTNKQNKTDSVETVPVLPNDKEDVIDFNDPAGAALGKYKNVKPQDLKSIIVKKGTEGVSIVQTGASYIVIIAFIVSLIVVATGPAFQHGYTMFGWAGMVFSLIAYAGIMNAPMIMYIFNRWATP